MSVNKVMLIGRLGRDPESKSSTPGKEVVTFSLATNSMFLNKTTGNKEEKTEWHNIVGFGKNAVVCSKYLKKGKKVYIEGYLQTRFWENTELGTKGSKTEVVIHHLHILDTIKKNDNPAPVENK